MQVRRYYIKSGEKPIQTSQEESPTLLLTYKQQALFGTKHQ